MKSRDTDRWWYLPLFTALAIAAMLAGVLAGWHIGNGDAP